MQTEPEELHRVDYLRSDLKHQLRNVVMTLKQQYGFQSLAEFNTLLERFGVAAEEIRGDVRGRPYRGLVYHVLDDDGQRTGAAVKASRLGDFFGWKALEEKFDASKQRLRQHPATLDRTRREIDRARSGGRKRMVFSAELRENGSDAVFRENDAGRIYGVTFIDRTTHQVFNGSWLGKEYAADAFEAWFNGREQESSTPIQEELRPLLPLEPPQPGLSSVEEFEEYIETHYVSMPDVMGELMDKTFAMLRAMKVPFVVLMPIHAGIYLPYGFSFTALRTQYELPLREIDLVGESLTGYTFHRISTKEAEALLAPVYDDAMASYTGYVKRNHQEWENLLGSGSREGLETVVLKNGEKTCGYALYQKGEGIITIQELMALAPAAKLELLRYFKGFYGTFEKLSNLSP